MKKNSPCSLSCLITISLMLPASGCVPAAVVGVMGGTTAVVTGMAEERGVGGVITDAALKSKITDRLNAISYDLANKILIAVYQRQVVLTGTVEDEKMQIDVVRAVWEIPNVETVYDDIHVGPMTSMGRIAQDSWVSTRLKTQLVLSKKAVSINYEYVTHEATIYLVGIAQNQAELDEVIQIARTIKGVKKVVSHIKVKDQNIHYQGNSQNYDDYPSHQPDDVSQPYHDRSMNQPAYQPDVIKTMPYEHNPYSMPGSSTDMTAPAAPLYGPNNYSAFND